MKVKKILRRKGRNKSVERNRGNSGYRRDDEIRRMIDGVSLVVAVVAVEPTKDSSVVLAYEMIHEIRDGLAE
uniref:Uncharacterized protein n=1 Tax=Vespula pensylvanica TaxID=30213 RepID=A0A834K868_VESPE|nr:hypothetical protein H0235_015223 [Vespula pensylvanica]